jgi:hypothetical protein
MNPVIYLNAEGARKLFGNLAVVGLPCRTTDKTPGAVYHEVVEVSTGEYIGGCISATGFGSTDPGETVTKNAIAEYHKHSDRLNAEFGPLNPETKRRELTPAG